MTSTAVEVNDVLVVLGKKFEALKDVTVSLPSKKIIGFIGPSGAGKTTLIRSIVGRQKLSRGEITVLGMPAGSPKLRQMVNYMPQETSIYSDLTVSENLRYFATMMGIKRRDIKNEIDRLLTVVDLRGHAQHVVTNLSGGQKRRLSLAVSLIGKPQLMILDEPTVGLDPLLRQELWQLFRKLAEGGTTLIISSHVMDEAERCDELLLIRNGSILANGSPAALCKQTNSATVEQSFLKLVKEGK